MKGHTFRWSRKHQKKTKRKGPDVFEVNRLYKNGLVLLVVKQRPVPAETAGRPWMKTNTSK